MMLLLAAALAQEDVCATIYTKDDLDLALSDAEHLLEKADLDRAINVLRKTEELIPCLDSLIDPHQLAVFGRAYALASFYQQDSDSALRWGRMFQVADPELGWGDLPEGHPLIRIVEEAGEPTLVTVKERGLLPPKKGALFLSGKLTLTPTARAEVPYFVQVFEGRGHLVHAYWQDGSAFPEKYLGPEGVLKAPKFYDPTTHTITAKGAPPKLDDGIPSPSSGPPLVPLAVGGGLVVASGILYAVAGITKAKLTCADHVDCPASDELTGLRTQANVMAIGAGVALAAGLGVGVTGMFVDADSPPGVVFFGRF